MSPPRPNSEVAGLNELLTVDEVAAWLKVSRNWVYEHTRERGAPRTDRLPHIKFGKMSASRPGSVRTFSRIPNSHDSICAASTTMAPELQHEEPARGNGSSRMARRNDRMAADVAETRKGVGDSLAGDGNCSRQHDRSESCDSKRSARVHGGSGLILSRRRVTAAGRRAGHNPITDHVHGRLQTNGAHVLPMYKHSTQKNIATSWRRICCVALATRPIIGDHASGDSAIRGRS